MELIIIISFLTFIGYREWQNLNHVKDLELKLMTKNPQEYAQMKNIERKAKPNKPKEEDELVDPLDVDPNDALKGMTNE